MGRDFFLSVFGFWIINKGYRFPVITMNVGYMVASFQGADATGQIILSLFGAVAGYILSEL